MSEIKPGTPLPWVLDQNAVHEEAHGGWCKVADCSRLVRYGPTRHAGYEITSANAAYIVTACNAYPSLLNGLREAREALDPFARLFWVGNLPDEHEFASGYSVGDIKRVQNTLAKLDTLLSQGTE